MWPLSSNVSPMRTPLLVALTLLCSSASACPVSLEGSWLSDKDASMSFYRANNRFEEKQIEFLSSLLGHMTFRFSGESMVTHMPDISVSVAGEQRPFEGFDAERPFRVLFCNEYQIAVEARQPFSEALGVTTFNIVSGDLMWVYSGSTMPTMPDTHFREFFRRVP